MSVVWRDCKGSCHVDVKCWNRVANPRSKEEDSVLEEYGSINFDQNETGKHEGIGERLLS